MKKTRKKSLTFLSFPLFMIGMISVQGFDLDSALHDTTQILKGQDEEKDTIIEKLHQKGITIFTTWESFMPNTQIRRDEAAKMLTLTKQALTHKLTTTWNDPVCAFTDLNEAWEDLRDLLQVSCYEGLFHGHQGKFMPKNDITKGEILTVAGRILYGVLDETNGHFATNYANQLHQDHYLEGTTLIDASQRDIPATRWDLAIILWNILK